MEDLIRQLKEYKDGLEKKNKAFVDALLDKGITVAVEKAGDGTHQMSRYVTFRKEFETEKGKTVVALLVGAGQTFPSMWQGKDGSPHADTVYPLSMLEFGSAGYALVSPEETFGATWGVGQGAMAQAGHEADVAWTVVRDGSYINPATAIAPTRPMYHAANKMMEDILKTAQEAFEV